MRGWYARRGVAWTPLLASCALAIACAVVGRTWPNAVTVLLPAALALCAAGAGFVFDEHASAVVAVTPRGAGWRRTTRVAVALLPLATWVVVLAVVPLPVDLHRGPWLLAGAAAVAARDRRGRARLARPGHGAGLVDRRRRRPRRPRPAPDEPVPRLGPAAQGPFPAPVVAFWIVAGGVGALACAWALRPGLR